MNVINDDTLRAMGAKYVFCTNRKIISRIDRSKILITPKYSVVWTDMEIKDAPAAATISIYVLDGMSAISINVQLADLHFLEKL